jgi:acyl-CoA synthetase (AMP-forming)/AMP-acid ligase II
VSIPAVLTATLDAHGERPAVVDGDERVTWDDLASSAERFGTALVAAGIGVGDRVAIWAPNGLRWIVAALGLWRAGATLVPVNTRFKGAEAADILERSGARVLVGTTDFLGADHVAMLSGAGVDLPALDAVVVASGPVPGRAAGREAPGWDVRGWEELMSDSSASARSELERRSAALGSDDVSDVLFTSGTTGRPKGVRMTHGRTLTVARDWAAMTGLGAEDRYLMVNPYFHMFGLKAGILACCAAGATMYPEPTFDPERTLARVEAERITVLPGPPTLYQAILDHPDLDGHDLSSLRVAVTGAADIPVKLIRRVRQELPFSIVITGYGLTEAGTATATTPEDGPEAVATTVGRARPGFEVRLVEGDRDVPDGGAGEILLRGPSVMLDYLDDPEATAAALSPEGWLRTGDLGSFDDHGDLRIVGRIKDMFIVGGFNAYPAEIEDALLRHPEVRQAAVIGVPDERLGQVGMAFVVTASSDPALGEAIRAWCRDEMANYKVPRRVEVVTELPLNAAGKVVKDELRDRAAAQG